MGLRQEVEALFFGDLGILGLYSHWVSDIPDRGVLFVRHGNWEPGQAPDSWAYSITTSNPVDSERLLRKVISYSTLYTAAEMIDEEKTDQAKPFHLPSPATGRACASWRYSDSLDEFDPHTIDELLQVAVWGGIRYPHFTVREES